MSNTNNTMQTQTSNALHNAIMEAGGKDNPPMLAPVAEGSSEITTERYIENYKNVSQDIRDLLNAEAATVQIILTGIDNDIYSTIDGCPNACEMWKAIERLKQDPKIPDGQATHTVITHNAAYQADDLDAYDFDCDKLNIAKVALIMNLSRYGSDALAEVHNHDNANTNMINQDVQEMPSSKQSNVVNHLETEITSAYSQYVIESQ
uniref:Uncharacterized protein n=1 Tax=Tanacetum cinerariifolium TaxID=118510 RepID=A0A699IG91_TANCI|nr:hypothetical protein [Tanacetum cinerariifolium]